jgi:hypothetical protein
MKEPQSNLAFDWPFTAECYDIKPFQIYEELVLVSTQVYSKIAMFRYW